MTFISSLDKTEYSQFISSHQEKAHFMQSVGWGEFNRIERGLKPYYVGLKDDNGELQAVALLLERKPFLFPSYFYSPSGFVIDFSNIDLLETFCEQLKAFCKEKRVMFLKVDPDVELREIDEDGNALENNLRDNSPFIEEMKKIGFSHLGFNKEFEGRQPRYTFRIDLQRDKEEIRSSIRGNVLKNVRKCEKNYETEIYIGDENDIDNLYRLINETSLRDNFYSFSKRFYTNFYKVLNEYSMVKLYMGKTYIKKTIDKLREQLKEVEKQKESYTKPQRIKEAEITKNRLLEEISEFSELQKKYGEEAITSAHLVVNYQNKAWAVHAGSASDMNQTFLNNRVYLYKIMDQKDSGAVFLDQFGTVGNWKDSKHRSLHEFKRQFGGRYIEFVGEFDLVIRRFWYNIYTKVLPRYRSFLFDIKAILRGKRI